MSVAEIRPRPSFFGSCWWDVRRHAELEKLNPSPGALEIISSLLAPGVMAVLLFRMSAVWHRMGVTPFSRLLHLVNIAVFGLDIWLGCVVGPGLTVPHPVGAVVVAKRLGRNVLLSLSLRLDPGFDDWQRDGQPAIGDGPRIFAGAKILGPVTIGDGVVVGANAVVLDSVPANAMVVGIPARIVRYRRQEAASTLSGAEPEQTRT